MEALQQLDSLLSAVKKADEAILKVYNSPSFDVISKADDSPITGADKASHLILTQALTELFPNAPVVSEEDDHTDTLQKLQSDKFWLVDPLDGTKEFVNKNGQFTVCIALIEHGKPSFGIVSAPTTDTVYYGGPGLGAFKKVASNEPTQIHVTKEPIGVVTASLSHLNDDIKNYIAQHYPNATVTRVGSSLKAMMVAEGLADAQPVLNSGMKLWDLAAGQAIVEGAGGYVSRPDGSEVNYQTSELLIGDFITRAAKSL